MRSLPNIRARHIFIVFGFGALSGLVASWAELGLLYNSVPFLTPFVTEPTVIMILAAVFIAPIVEELAKPLGLYFIQGEEKPNFALQEWAFLGAIAGFGFAVLENILYASVMGTYGPEASISLLVLRFMLPLHMIASAIVGYGFGLWVKTGKGKYFILCLLTAMLLHGAFNLAALFVG